MLYYCLRVLLDLFVKHVLLGNGRVVLGTTPETLGILPTYEDSFFLLFCLEYVIFVSFCSNLTINRRVMQNSLLFSFLLQKQKTRVAK